MRNAQIIATGAYVPERIVDNAYFDESLGVDVSEWLETVVKIEERRWASDDQATSDLCYHACRQCLERAGIDIAEVDLIIVATDTPDFISPSTAAVLQDKLEARNAGTFDVNAACSGFVTALDIGAKYIQSDPQYNKVLVVGGYAMSKHLNMADKKTVTLFADGAGAVLLSSIGEREKGFLGSELKSLGQYNSWMGIYGGGTSLPISKTTIANNDHKLKFVHRFPKEINPETWTKMSKTMNDKLGVTANDIDMYFITQLNINGIWETMDNLGVSRNKAHTIMHNYGYTGSACIPMALNDAFEKDLIRSGDLIYLIGSGGGLAFASAAFQL